MCGWEEGSSHSAFFSPPAALAALSAANFFFTNLMSSLIINEDMLDKCGLIRNRENADGGDWRIDLLPLIEERELV